MTIDPALVGVGLARVFVGAILVMAGTAKLKAGNREFARAVGAYELVPQRIADFVARVVPWGEVLAGALLVVGLATRPAAVVAFGLLAVFSGALAIALIRGKKEGCGCFGRAKSELIRWRLVYRNLVIGALLLPVYAASGGAIRLDAVLLPMTPTTNDQFLLPLIGAWFAALALIPIAHQLTHRRGAQSRTGGAS